MSNLPYVTAPGNIEKALLGIKSASVPERVSQDFVKTILQVKGGSGDQMTSFLRKVGFANGDGTPSELYKRFRNSASSGAAAAESLRTGFAPLYVRNEYMHKLSDDHLRGLIIEETGQGESSSAIPLILSAIKNIKKFADFAPTQVNTGELTPVLPLHEPPPLIPPIQNNRDSMGFNLSYTINLNLPTTSDVAVFNAIFKSLRENLLHHED